MSGWSFSMALASSVWYAPSSSSGGRPWWISATRARSGDSPLNKLAWFPGCEDSAVFYFFSYRHVDGGVGKELQLCALIWGGVLLIRLPRRGEKMEGERWWSKRNGRAHMVLRRTELLPSVRAGFLPSVLDLLSQALVKVIQRCSSLLDNKLLAPRAVLPLVLDILSPAAPSPWAPFDPGAQIPDWSDGPVVICVAAHRCLQLLERLRFGERKKWFG